jgi:hypothetical protein
MFTEYKFSPSQISQAAADTARALSASQPGTNPAQFAAGIIAGRLSAKPENYLQYGPYWWALKTALRALGNDFGQVDDAGIRGEYGADFPAYGVLVAAEQFRDFYGKTFFAGTARFDLDGESEESYVLFDTDMEIRRLGGANPLRVAADLQAVELPAEAVLDSAVAVSLLDATLTPFRVKFEHEAQLWTATVYATDRACADSKVKMLQDSGRIGRAIEASKDAGGMLLDSAGHAEPLFVDRDSKSVSEMAPRQFDTI